MDVTEPLLKYDDKTLKVDIYQPLGYTSEPMSSSTSRLRNNSMMTTNTDTSEAFKITRVLFTMSDLMTLDDFLYSESVQLDEEELLVMSERSIVEAVNRLKQP